MQQHTTIVTAALLAFAAGAHADIYSGPNYNEVAPPVSVEEGQLEGNANVKVFFETSTLLTADLGLDHQPSGLVDEPADVVTGLVPANTRVESYFVHFDPVGTSTLAISATIEFNSDILGVIFESAALNATDTSLGLGSVTYPTDTGRQTEISGDDSFEISADRRSVTVSLNAGNSVDHMRVITAPSPRLVHEYNFEGAGFDSAGDADAVPGSAVEFRRPDQGVPFALGQAYRMGSGLGPNGVFAIPQADFTEFGLNDFTIAFSLRRLQNDASDIDFVLDARNTDGWDVVLTDGGAIAFRNFRGANVSFESPQIVFGSSNNEWHHLAFVYDRSEADGARWYFDGELISADDATAMIEPAISDLNDILIGGQSGVGANESLDGQMGRLRFWNHALTTEQVQSVAAEAGFFAPGPICPGDINRDGATNIFDFSEFAADFGCQE